MNPDANSYSSYAALPPSESARIRPFPLLAPPIDAQDITQLGMLGNRGIMMLEGVLEVELSLVIVLEQGDIFTVGSTHQIFFCDRSKIDAC